MSERRGGAGAGQGVMNRNDTAAGAGLLGGRGAGVGGLAAIRAVAGCGSLPRGKGKRMRRVRVQGVVVGLIGCRGEERWCGRGEGAGAGGRFTRG